MIDWLASLSAQDQSLEGLLARRNMEKQLGMLQDVARVSENKRQHGVDTGLREREIGEQAKYREAQQAQTAAERERMAKEREIDNKRARYSAAAARRKPGDQITDPQVQADVREFEGSDALGEDNIYRKHEYEQAQLKFKQQEEIRKAEEKRQQRELQLREKADSRAEKDQKLRETREERVASAAEAKRKAAEGAMKDVPASLRPAIKARAEEIISANKSMWDLLPWHDAQSNEADAWLTAAGEVKKKAQEQNLMPITGPVATPAPGGRGAGAGTSGGGAYLTDEEVKAKFPNLPPGSRVRRVQ